MEEKYRLSGTKEDRTDRRTSLISAFAWKSERCTISRRSGAGLEHFMTTRQRYIETFFQFYLLTHEHLLKSPCDSSGTVAG